MSTKTESKKINKHIMLVMTICKYLFPVVLSFVTIFHTHTKRYTFVICVEVVIVALLSNLLLKKKS